jgi:hypothetical protein
MEKLNGKDHLEDIGINAKIILEWILGKQDIDWIHLAHERDQWQALLNTVINIQVP